MSYDCILVTRSLGDGTSVGRNMWWGVTAPDFSQHYSMDTKLRFLPPTEAAHISAALLRVPLSRLHFLTSLPIVPAPAPVFLLLLSGTSEFILSSRPTKNTGENLQFALWIPMSHKRLLRTLNPKTQWNFSVACTLTNSYLKMVPWTKSLTWKHKVAKPQSVPWPHPYCQKLLSQSCHFPLVHSTPWVWFHNPHNSCSPLSLYFLLPSQAGVTFDWTADMLFLELSGGKLTWTPLTSIQYTSLWCHRPLGGDFPYRYLPCLGASREMFPFLT